MKRSKPIASIRMDEAILEKLKSIAILEKRSLNGQAEIAIEKFVRDYENEHGEIELADE